MTKILHTKVEIGSPLLASDITDLTFFPVGMIMLMDGSWQDGRGGWYICDGQSRTIPGLGAVTMPDLRDRFIRGGAAGGSVGGGTAILDTVNLPSHNHSLSGLTVTGGGAHSHGVGTLAAASGSATHSHG
ncbi:MAG: hypothetical protein LBJ25_03800, partial [Candidatus Margulisbacteria bacterium]|nr:hypothetical protein [Candidatus Margulisiibacteriota bacterium]